ncbi:hypothetical protein Nepgr_007793 [Nepenthes gracilis]|uniref:Uncharacterized protein n=1 Tax=Nepenthes gracilis TaxID=150966 RepID=A0AAD3XIM3_NEPGR|nr:hypothetical protein Nepgr_007793 [Nepenthes gracilis]
MLDMCPFWMVWFPLSGSCRDLVLEFLSLRWGSCWQSAWLSTVIALPSALTVFFDHCVDESNAGASACGHFERYPVYRYGDWCIHWSLVRVGLMWPGWSALSLGVKHFLSNPLTCRLTKKCRGEYSNNTGPCFCIPGWCADKHSSRCCRWSRAGAFSRSGLAGHREKPLAAEVVAPVSPPRWIPQRLRIGAVVIVHSGLLPPFVAMSGTDKLFLGHAPMGTHRVLMFADPELSRCFGCMEDPITGVGVCFCVLMPVNFGQLLQLLGHGAVSLPILQFFLGLVEMCPVFLIGYGFASVEFVVCTSELVP